MEWNLRKERSNRLFHRSPLQPLALVGSWQSAVMLDEAIGFLLLPFSFLVVSLSLSLFGFLSFL
jgi:hypothetical protein